MVASSRTFGSAHPVTASRPISVRQVVVRNGGATVGRVEERGDLLREDRGGDPALWCGSASAGGLGRRVRAAVGRGSARPSAAGSSGRRRSARSRRPRQRQVGRDLVGVLGPGGVVEPHQRGPWVVTPIPRSAASPDTLRRARSWLMTSPDRLRPRQGRSAFRRPGYMLVTRSLRCGSTCRPPAMTPRAASRSPTCAGTDGTDPLQPAPRHAWPMMPRTAAAASRRYGLRTVSHCPGLAVGPASGQITAMDCLTSLGIGSQFEPVALARDGDLTPRQSRSPSAGRRLGAA